MDNVFVIVLMICHPPIIFACKWDEEWFVVIGEMRVFKESDQAECGTEYIKDLPPPVALGQLNVSLKAQKS